MVLLLLLLLVVVVVVVVVWWRCCHGRRDLAVEERHVRRVQRRRELVVLVQPSLKRDKNAIRARSYRAYVYFSSVIGRSSAHLLRLGERVGLDGDRERDGGVRVVLADVVERRVLAPARRYRRDDAEIPPR